MVPLICAIVVGLSGLVVPAPVLEDGEQYYTTKYDHVDIEMILNNRRLVSYYAACMLNKGPCPPEGLEFKRILPDAIQTNCVKCTEKQKATTLRTIKRLMKEYKKIWDQLKAEWDPDDVFVKKFLETYNKPTSTVSSIFSNRFGDEEFSEQTQAPLNKPKEPMKSSTTTTTTTSTTSTTSATLGVFLPPTATRAPAPNAVNPLANSLGQTIKATVSLGNNIARQVIKDIETIGNTVISTGVEIGNRVIQTGTQIAGALRGIPRPVNRFNN
uniref:Chemosensory protein 3 n=1 Tax=Pyrrhalta aenescens TaxID=281545 RepID=A0A1J0KKP6_9CUCU|nr:chemosensory protein 3 [Pyrrhalta aenescens]